MIWLEASDIRYPPAFQLPGGAFHEPRMVRFLRCSNCGNRFSSDRVDFDIWLARSRPATGTPPRSRDGEVGMQRGNLLLPFYQDCAGS